MIRVTIWYEKLQECGDTRREFFPDWPEDIFQRFKKYFEENNMDVFLEKLKKIPYQIEYLHGCMKGSPAALMR